MASFHQNSQQSFISNPINNNDEVDTDDYNKTHEKHRNTVPILPKERGWMTEHLVKYQGVWLSPMAGLKGVMLVQHHFKAQPTDILLATFPKSGTTWFKALIFTIINRTNFSFSKHPLLTNGPHGCVPFLEAMTTQNNHTSSQDHHLSPRFFATHIPYALLPVSITSSGCKIIYIFRNPKDVLVSNWLYLKKLRPKELPIFPLEEAFKLFCQGVSHFGPFWDHVLGYWNASLVSPGKVLFLTYEEMKMEPIVHVKRLAEFLGHPFSLEEERERVVHEIIKLCSFENLSNLEVNKSGVQQFTPQFAVQNSNFFRKGEVGDWKNYLTAEMIERLDQITEQKFNGRQLFWDRLRLGAWTEPNKRFADVLGFTPAHPNNTTVWCSRFTIDLSAE